jgi:CubicO group peptidase (beta-lactamase class C family)
MMGRNQIGDLKLQALPSLLPQFVKGGVTPPGDKFGLGFALNSQAEEGGRGPNSMVWGGVYNTSFWIDREKGLTGVLMMQISPFADDGASKVQSDFNRAVYAWLHS